MYLMKLKNGGRGKAIVWDTKDVGDNWELDKQLSLSKVTEEVEVNGEKIEVYSSPMIQFHIRHETNLLESCVKKGKKNA